MGKPFFWKAKQACYVNYIKRDGRPGRRRLEAENENQARKAWAEFFNYATFVSKDECWVWP
jgi:hypothetical protein